MSQGIPQMIEIATEKRWKEDFENKLRSINGDITLANVRDVTDSSRKYTLPLLEYFDSQGVTRRAGDKRILIKK